MSTSRIQLTNSMMEILTKMSEGNPGAVTTLIEMIQVNKAIDPDSAFGEFSAILGLDSFGIYGTDIYILHNDICERDMVKTIAVLRSIQLGMFPREILKDACHRQDRSGCELVPVEDLYLKVKERLPNFNSVE